MVAPKIEILSYTTSKISRQPGIDRATVTFRYDQGLAQFEARAGGAGVGQGLLVESAANLKTLLLESFPSTLAGLNNQYPTLKDLSWGEYTFYVDDEELTEGDKDYRINLYGSNGLGEWNTYGS